MSKVITLAMLIENKACEKQVNLFQEYFGDSVEITDEVCFQYYDEFDIGWLVDNILNDEQKGAYKEIEGSAMAAYEAIEGPAYEAYEAIVGPAFEDYKSIDGPEWKVYEAIHGAAYEAYLAIQGSAWEAYKKERARAFWLAYNS